MMAIKAEDVFPGGEVDPNPVCLVEAKKKIIYPIPSTEESGLTSSRDL